MMLSYSSVRQTLAQISRDPSLPPPTILQASATTCVALPWPLSILKSSWIPRFPMQESNPCRGDGVGSYHFYKLWYLEWSFSHLYVSRIWSLHLGGRVGNLHGAFLGCWGRLRWSGTSCIHECWTSWRTPPLAMVLQNQYNKWTNSSEVLIVNHNIGIFEIYFACIKS